MPSDNFEPAFPVVEGGSLYGSYGMSLRDYFAAQALTGVMATASVPETVSFEERKAAFLTVSKILYEIADAMLVARKQEQ